MARFAVLLLVVIPAALPAGVIITGVDGELLDNIRIHLQIDNEACDSPNWRIRRFYQQVEQELHHAVEAYGYYSATVVKSMQTDENCWTVMLDVDLGQPVLVRSVAIRLDGPGASGPELEALRMNVPIVIGSVLNHADYEQYKRRFSDTASQLGFFDAKFSVSRIDVYPQEQAADIVLDFNTGPRYQFGSVSFDQSVISADLAERFIDFIPGQNYDVSIIRDLHKAFLETGYFSGVDIRTTPNGAPDFVVDIVINLTAAKHRSYNAGVGFGTDSGPKLRTGYINRRRNTRGHQFEFNASYSPVIAEIGAGYKLPLDNPRKKWLNFDVGYKRENPETSDSQLYKVGAKRLRRLSELWARTLFLDYSFEDYVVGTDAGRTSLLTPGVSWKRSVIDIDARPRQGVSANMRFTGAADVLLSDTSFLQFHAFGKIIRPLWESARVIGRLELGATLKDDVSDLPASVRFFAGGDVSVRGYDYKSLGPTDELGVVTGGNQLLVGSLELDQLVRPGWSVALFVDAGNAFDRFLDNSFAIGIGTGIRWYSPLGPIRFDVAVPLQDSAPDSFRIHITLGPDL
ncbi:MAG: outer membrane protein assembly factor [Gammaproteobacteria bacterium]|nr:MAG: outer membrane protein assembly factor [Gammaproteobacteria bacterium]